MPVLLGPSGGGGEGEKDREAERQTDKELTLLPKDWCPRPQ